MITTTKEEQIVLTNMQKYGGGFVKALAGAFIRADRNNFNKLRNAFPDYWKEYKKF